MSYRQDFGVKAFEALQADEKSGARGDSMTLFRVAIVKPVSWGLRTGVKKQVRADGSLLKARLFVKQIFLHVSAK